MARAAGKGAAFGAALLAAEDAAAEVVRYVDREGRVHAVTVRVEAPAGEVAAGEEGASRAEVGAARADAGAAAVSTGEAGASRAEAGVARAEAGASTAGAAAAAPPAVTPGRAWGVGGAAEEFPYAAYVREAAALYSLPVELILAVMKVESGFDPNAVSRSGAMGLMQLMPGTAAEVGVRDPFDPRQNVLGGARYLRIMINAFDGSVPLALAAYHAGAGAVDRYAGVPPYPETRRYVERVRELYWWYRERGTQHR